MNERNYPEGTFHHSENHPSATCQITKQFGDMTFAQPKPQIESNMPRFLNTTNDKFPNRFAQPIKNNLNSVHSNNQLNMYSQKSNLNAPDQINQSSDYLDKTHINPIYSDNINLHSTSSTGDFNIYSSSSNFNHQPYFKPISSNVQNMQASVTSNHLKENFPISNVNQLPNSNQYPLQTMPHIQYSDVKPPLMPQLSSNFPSSPPPHQNSSELNSLKTYPAPPLGNINRATYPPSCEQFQSQDISKYPCSNISSNLIDQPPNFGMEQTQQFSSNLSAPPYPVNRTQQSLNPAMLPNPIIVMEEDKRFRSVPFHTNNVGEVPPLVTTDFIVHDEGISSPKFLRSTIYNVPCQYEMLKQSYLPFALIINPFSKLKDQEILPPISDLGGFGPVRCIRCKAYMCSFMKFIDGGKQFQCAFCDAFTEVPQEYFAYLDNMGYRSDKFQRPELCLGSYEFIATAEYCKNEQFPNPPAFVFLIDVSYNNIKNGVVQLLCQNMKMLLKALPMEGDADTSAIRVGFVTYNDVVHFYNIKSKLSQPQMLTVSDIEDMFVPLIDGFFVSPEEAEIVIDSLMEQIPIIFADSIQTGTVLGPAIQAGLEALKAAGCCGKLFVFHSTLPTAEAPGKLKNREDRGLLGTEKEKMILNPQTTFYTELGQDCVAAGCSVDLFLFPNSYIDIATIGELCHLTGGQVHKYSYFQVNTDGKRFIADVKSIISRSVVFDAVMRVRTSAGIRATDFYGSFYMANSTDLEIASLDNTKSIVAEIKYDDKLQENAKSFIQVATLYTSCSGQRRIRINNLCLNNCSQMMDLFQGTSEDAIIHFFLKRALKLLSEEPPQQVKESIKFSVKNMFMAYIKFIKSQSSSSQPILPENLKLLPLHINCLLKCDAISGGPDMTIDDRSLDMLTVNSMDLCSTIWYLYPRLVSLIDLDIMPPDAPTMLQCSASNIKENGAYLLENGITIFIWIGKIVTINWIQDVFGVHSIAEIDPEMSNLPEKNTTISQRIRSFIDKIRKERSKYLQLLIIRQGDKLESLFRQLLVEDRGIRGMSYAEYMCELQKEIYS